MYVFCRFDISTINPPLIFGPLLHEIASASALNTSVGAFYAYLTGAKTDKDATAASGCYVDVRDVARLHVESLEVEKAGGKRFAVSHGMSSSILFQSPQGLSGLTIVSSP